MKLQRKKTAPLPAHLVRPDPATLDLVLYPHPVLKKVARDVDHFDPWLHAFVERMKDVMLENKGVGLAASQIGIPLRVFVASPSGKREEAVVFINPVLSDEMGTDEAEEGCLSLPDIRIIVPRFKSLRIEARDIHGQPFSANVAEFPARIMQHENDHLDGILLVDRMGPVARIAHRKKIKELEAAANLKK